MTLLRLPGTAGFQPAPSIAPALLIPRSVSLPIMFGKGPDPALLAWCRRFM